jgi:signal peptidase I
MSPTIEPGDRILADGLAYATEPVRTGDVVLLRPTPSRMQACAIGDARPAPSVERVIGVAGDRVEVRGGRTLVNGVAVAIAGSERPTSDQTFPVVPPGAVLAFADSRNEACDSSRASDPFVPLANVIGRAEAVFFPREHVGFLKRGGGIERVDAGSSRTARRFDFSIGLGASAESILRQSAALRWCATHRRCGRTMPYSRQALAGALAAERAGLARALRGLEGDCAFPLGRRIIGVLGGDQRASLRRPFGRTSSLRLAAALERHLADALIRVSACWP